MKPLIPILIFFLLIAPAVTTFDPIRPNKDYWTCYDHSLNYSKHNPDPDWGLVTMSTHPYFRGVPHVVNYKKMNNDSLLIHDGTINSTYILAGWKNGGYYHFWGNETPPRNYKFLRDNRHVI